MRVLIVANYNRGHFSPFVVEQAESLRRKGVDFDYFRVIGKGSRGYLLNLKSLNRKIKEFKPDIIHAHYGLTGLLANLQRRVPVVTTYHGSDIHEDGMILLLSKLTMRLSAHNIFVSTYLKEGAGIGGKHVSLLPCGVETEAFIPMDRSSARKLLGWNEQGQYVLFSGAFDNPVKNYALAKDAVSRLENVELIELLRFTREQVVWAMNASNCLLMTSHKEGSPQVIKEAMSCRIPIVSVDVGDVRERLTGIDGCYVADRYDPALLAELIQRALNFTGKTNGREAIIQSGLQNDVIADALIEIYKKCIR